MTIDKTRNEWNHLCYPNYYPFPDDSFEMRFNQYNRAAQGFRLIVSTGAEDQSYAADDFVDIAESFICELAERAEMWWCEHGKKRGESEIIQEAVNHAIDAFQEFECEPTVSTLDKCELTPYVERSYELLVGCSIVAGRAGHFDDRMRIWFWDEQPKLTTLDERILELLAGRDEPMKQEEVCTEIRKERVGSKGQISARLARLNRYGIIVNPKRQGYQFHRRDDRKRLVVDRVDTIRLGSPGQRIIIERTIVRGE